MNNSSNFNFKLPSTSDTYNINDFNDNFQTIDANMLTVKLGGSISANSNLNNIVTPGVYQIDSSIMSGLSNSPVSSGYAVLVVRNIYSVNGIIQTLFWRATTSLTTRVYVRSYLSSSYSWTAWKSDINSGMYNDLSDTKLVTASSTTAQVGANMLLGGSVSWYHNSSHSIKITDAPAAVGMVTLWKYPTGTITGLFQGGNGVIYHKPYNSTTWISLTSYVNQYVTASTVE